MRELDYRESPALHIANNTYFVPKDLMSCTHVYLRVDRIRKALEAPYSGPFRVLRRFERCFEIQFPSGRNSVVSIDRLKPAREAKQPVVVPVAQPETEPERTVPLEPSVVSKMGNQVPEAPRGIVGR